MKKAMVAAISAVALLLSGCGNTDETYLPEQYVAENDSRDKNEAHTENSVQAVYSSRPVSSAHTSSVSAFTPTPDGELRQTFQADGDTLSYIAENVFSGGEYYTVVVSAKRTDTRTENTVYINGELYEKPTLSLYHKMRKRSTLVLDIPDGDRFITLESAADSYFYGGEVISNMREYGAAEYPDILGLVFQSRNAEAAVPEYARYFAVFDGKLTELAIYENGNAVSPRGAKLEPSSVGVAKQFLTVRKSGGNGYEVIKYEYRFDIENGLLIRKRVKFYGWEY